MTSSGKSLNGNIILQTLFENTQSEVTSFACITRFFSWPERRTVTSSDERPIRWPLTLHSLKRQQ